MNAIFFGVDSCEKIHALSQLIVSLVLLYLHLQLIYQVYGISFSLEPCGQLIHHFHHDVDHLFLFLFPFDNIFGIKVRQLGANVGGSSITRLFVGTSHKTCNTQFQSAR